MKNFLIILPWFPYPIKSGGDQAIYNGIRALSGNFNLYIAYLCKYNKAVSDKDVKDFCDSIDNNTVKKVIPIYNSQNIFLSYYENFVFKIVNAFFKKKALYNQFIYRILRKDHPASYYKLIGDLFKEYDFDAVQMEMIATAKFVHIVPENIKKIFVCHEIAFTRYGQIVNGRDEDYKSRVLYEIAKDSEVSLMKNYDAVITLSKEDASRFLENGIEKDKLHPSYAIINEPKRCCSKENSKILTFIGSGPHAPNFMGLQWFLDNCWENLLSKDENFELHIIGQWTSKQKITLKSKYKNIKFLGFVDDLTDALDSSTSIVPITVGAGIRMKILDTVSRKVPFVSTTVGAEGLPFVSGEDCYITDNPSEFVESIIKLQNKELREKMVENAYKKYKQIFSIEAYSKNRLEIVNKILDED